MKILIDKEKLELRIAELKSINHSANDFAIQELKSILQQGEEYKGSFDEERYAVTRVIDDKQEVDVEKLAKLEFPNDAPTNIQHTKDIELRRALFIRGYKAAQSKQEESSNWDEVKLFIRNKIIENKQSVEFIDWFTCLNMLEDYYNPPVKR